MKKVFLISIGLLTGLFLNAQKAEKEELIITYLNADKMYDTIDNEGSYDDDFTAGGQKFWGKQRYDEKLDSIEELLLNVNGKELPGILVISEIETRDVLDDLLDRKALRRMNYSVHFYQHDNGKSVAVLSSGDLWDETTRIIEPEQPDPAARAFITYCSYVLPDGNRYHLFINNWTERSDGPGGSETARINCAVAVRKEIDNILNFERDARIIIMGSFYDEPTNKSVMTMLNASNKRKNISYRDLYNPFYDIHNMDNKGTVEVNGQLQMYDFIIISPQLLRENSGYSSGFNSGGISGEGSERPNPTFRAADYLGGAGGHLPVYIRLNRTLEK